MTAPLSTLTIRSPTDPIYQLVEVSNEHVPEFAEVPSTECDFPAFGPASWEFMDINIVHDTELSTEPDVGYLQVIDSGIFY